jgi:ATP adenylyltransferase/5',5'''-P-1,P-4-tetraphosphate phosphorylase II
MPKKITKYTIAEIKEVFWETFHKSGELWFGYLGTEEDNEDTTNQYWEDFLNNLVAQSQKEEKNAKTN